MTIKENYTTNILKSKQIKNTVKGFKIYFLNVPKMYAFRF